MNPLAALRWTPVVIVMLSLATHAWAKDPEAVVVHRFETKQHTLGPGLKGVVYNKKSYKYSRGRPIRLRADHSLLLTAWSRDFQPQITVRSKGSKRILKRGVFDPKPRKKPGGTYRLTHLEFIPPDRGEFIVTVSTDTISQGTYFIQGAVWGVAKPKPATTDEDAPTAGETSLRGFAYKSYKPYVSKRQHYVGGAYAKGGKHAAEVGATWLEGGDKAKTLGSPKDKKLGYGQVERQAGNVTYFKPEGTTSRGTFTVRSYKIMLFHPTKEVHVLVRVQAAHKAAIPAFVAKARALLAKYAASARPIS